MRLQLEATAGHATDELRIDLHPAGRPKPLHRAAIRITGHASASFRLPPMETDAIEVRIASSFLPSVRPLKVDLVAP